MSFGAVLSFVFGVLSPAALLVACVFELLARRMAGKRNPDTARLEKWQMVADIGLVAAWILLGIAYACFKYLTADAAAWQGVFQNFMSGCLIALVVLDIIYLYLRRARPRKSGSKKHFWEV